MEATVEAAALDAPARAAGVAAGEEQNVIPFVRVFVAAEAAPVPVIEGGGVTAAHPPTCVAAVANAL